MATWICWTNNAYIDACTLIVVIILIHLIELNIHLQWVSLNFAMKNGDKENSDNE
ncbi:ac97 [Troides aeacus nucleopolyhedrovirus]|nr:ac97 [Troides aeacus nucleopolyhedrovirus]